MAHETHTGHAHQHGETCGHTKVRHEDHVDYVHDGHLHHAHEGHVDEHSLGVSGNQPARCDSHECGSHAKDHQHSTSCGHEQVPHGDHVDYIVGSHLHNQHGNHCDDHGAVTVA